MRGGTKLDQESFIAQTVYLKSPFGLIFGKGKHKNLQEAIRAG